MPEKIKSRLSSVIDGNNCGIEIYFITEDSGNKKIKRANIVEPADQDILKMVFDFSKSKILDNDKLQLLKLSQADERKEVIYSYDLDEVLPSISLLNDVENSTDFEIFDFDKVKMSQIKGFIFAIGNNKNKFFIYKHMYPVSLLKRDSKALGLVKHGNRLIKLDDDILRINGKFDLFRLDGVVYVLNVQTLETFYGFKEAITNLSKRGLEKIVAANIVLDTSLLLNRTDNIAFARKLVRATKNSPVLGIVSGEEIIDFIKTHPVLNMKFKISDCGSKLDLKTKVSQEFFLKVLSDDFLQSELTKRHYSSLAKDAFDIDLQEA